MPPQSAPVSKAAAAFETAGPTPDNCSPACPHSAVLNMAKPCLNSGVLGIPALVGQVLQRVGPEAQVAGDPADARRRSTRPPLTAARSAGLTSARAARSASEIFRPRWALAMHVGEIVFEGNAGHGTRILIASKAIDADR